MIVDANVLLYAHNEADPRHVAAKRWHRITGPLFIDAQLAALAIDHGVPVISSDADFARFPEVTWVDPLRL